MSSDANTMKPITFTELYQKYSIQLTSNGIVLQVDSDWVVDNEERLSYTTMTRLVECCREYHWQLDILPHVIENSIDSITKSLTAEFYNPIYINTPMKISYYVTEVRRKGYSLTFNLGHANQQSINARFTMVNVFYDSQASLAIAVPEAILAYLKAQVSIPPPY